MSAIPDLLVSRRGQPCALRAVHREQCGPAVWIGSLKRVKPRNQGQGLFEALPAPIGQLATRHRFQPGSAAPVARVLQPLLVAVSCGIVALGCFRLLSLVPGPAERGKEAGTPQ